MRNQIVTSENVSDNIAMDNLANGCVSCSSLCRHLDVVCVDVAAGLECRLVGRNLGATLLDVVLLLLGLGGTKA